MQIKRRTIVQSLLTLPIWASVNKAVFSFPIGEIKEGTQPFDVVRFINTVQLWTKAEGGKYLETKDLQNCKALTALKKNADAEIMNVGSTLISSLSFQSQEIIPEWEIKMSTSDEGQRYVLVLKQKSTGHAFGSDQKGVIYRGTVDEQVFRNGAFTDLKPVLRDPVPYKATKKENNKNVGGFFSRAAAFTTATSCFIFCSIYSCCGECINGFPDPGPNCINYGCTSCVWCCT